MVWAILVFIILGISVAAVFKYSKGRVAELPVYGKLSEFSFTASNGNSYGSMNLKNRVWIADFIFTRCAGPCPMMSLQMSKLQEQLGAFPEIRLVSFSVDPEFDTTAVLSEYAKKFKAIDGKWIFLTGKKEAIHKFAVENFKLVAETVPKSQQTDEGGSILHSTHFVLVDSTGRIRGYYDGSDTQRFQQLVVDAKNLRMETGR